MLPITLSPELTYATKPNIAYPGSSAQATAAEGLAQDRLDDYLASTDFGLDGITITVAAGAIEVAT